MAHAMTPDDLGAEIPALYRFARALVRDEHLAADLVQDTLARAIERADQYRSDAPLGAWLKRILRNLATDRARRSEREVIVEEKQQHLDALTERLKLGPSKFIAVLGQDLAVLGARLSPDRFRRELDREHEHLERLSARLAPAMKRAWRDDRQRWSALSDRLESVSPRRVLERGYAMVWDTDGAPVTAAAKVSTGAALTVEFGDGKVGVTAGEGVPRPARPKRADEKLPEKQGKLF